MTGMNHITDPAMFERFHKALTSERQGYTPWYFLLSKGLKDPVAGISWKQLEGRLTFEQAILKMRAGHNIGIAATGMDALCIVDVDDIEATPDEIVKPTLSTRSRKRIGRHYFYFTDDPRCKENLPTESKGEIRSSFEYVVAPGSFVLCDSKTMAAMPEAQRELAGHYSVENERAPDTIKFEELPPVFLEQAQKNKEAEKETREKRKAKAKARKDKKPAQGGDRNRSGMWDLSIDDVTSIPNKSRFTSLFHESTTGKNTALNSEGGLTCWRHLVTHTPLSALAVLAGVADCNSAGQGVNNGKSSSIDYGDGGTLFKMWAYAKREGMIPKDDPMPAEAIRWHAVENGICKPNDIVDGWKLPSQAYNQTLALIESEEGISTGRQATKPGAAQNDKAPKAIQTDESTPYGIEDGCFVKYEQVRGENGEWVTKTRVLCNFTIVLQTDTLTNDGITSERWYEGEILANGHRLPFKDEARKFVTPADHGRVLATAGGSALTFETRNLQDIRHAMQATSTPICRNIRQTFGLRDTFTYETPSITIDRDGVHETKTRDIDLTGKGGAKHLDMKVLTDTEFKEVGEHIRDDLLNLRTRYVIDSLTGFTFLAPFVSELMRTTGWTGEHIGLFLVGTTGRGKSFDAGMFQWFFGDFSANGAMTSWTATPNEIQVAGYYFNDAVYLVDDFKLSHFKGNPSRYSAAIGVMQNYSDGTARDRLTSDIKIREGQPIRGALIVTGEDFPHNEASIEGRYHVIHIDGDGDRTAGRRCLKNRYHYSGFMARYIAWVFQKDGYATEIVNRIDEHRETFIKGKETATNIDRLAQSFAYNLTGYELFCHFMSDNSFIDSKTAHNMIDAHKRELIANIGAAADSMASATAGKMYLEILTELIASGRFKIHDWEDWHTVSNPDYDRDDPDSDEMMSEPIPLEDTHNCIGFDNDPEDPYLYIMQNVAFAEVCRVATTQGMPFNHTQTGTGNELVAGGVLMNGSDGKTARGKWYQNKNRKVWYIAKHALNYERVTKYEQLGLEGITE